MKHPHPLLIDLATVVVALSLVSLTPAGAALGVLFCVPVLLGSLHDQPRTLLRSAAVALAGVLAAMRLDPALRPHAWLLPTLLVAGATALALRLQAERRELLSERETARTASEMNRLLMSLLAHDLRSPLVLADQGLHYVEESVVNGYPIDRGLVTDLRARLQRSLRALGLVLTLAREDAARSGDAATIPAAVDLREELAAEISSFGYEAQARGKQLVGELDELPPGRYHVDGLVLRQAVAVALDNAVRYADPGMIRVRASVAGPAVEVRVEDPGPGIGAHQADEQRAKGTGLGMRLCAALLVRAGGSLSIERDAPSGTVIAIRLPATPVTKPAPAGHASHPVGV